MWTLENAFPLIRKISPIARRHGFSVALYGSVLDRGESENDLDLFFIEQEPDICDAQGCIEEIAKLPEISHASELITGTGGHICVIWLSGSNEHIDAQFRLQGV
jgi:hypothetical protein